MRKPAHGGRSLGFSLLEIIIVLALAGLIVLIVFLLMGPAQSNRRDAQRKAYIVRVAANLDKYKDAAANNYQYPSFHDFDLNFQVTPSVGPYAVTQSSNDPSSGLPYQMINVSPTGTGTIYYTQAQCPPATGSGNNFYSLTIMLESAGATYCIDNH